jgi:tripartite-type tricarboxylate transporter receptor subunit TctC
MKIAIAGCAGRLLAVALAVIPLANVHAQNYPVRPVRLIIPLPPGGGADFLGRLLAQKLTDNMGKQFVVDNRGGAGGSVGSQAAARSASDGYTLLLGYIASHGMNPALSKLPYDPVTDFAPISLIASAPNMLVVHPSVQAKSVQALIAYAKGNPGKLRYASAGNGSAPHLSGELFNHLAGTSMIHVPYKGAGPALIDVMAGEVELTFTSLPAGLPHGKAGKVRMLAVTGLKRSSLLPDLPTVAESGLPVYSTDQWYGVLAPARTPAQLITLLHKEISVAMSDPALADRARSQGFDVGASTPAEFSKHIQSEVAKWTRLVKAASIKAD